jgi:hypothetical protein
MEVYMYYRDNYEANDIYQDQNDEYEEFLKNTPYYNQQTPYSPQYYQMMSFYPMMRMPMVEDKDGDLKMLYPKIHIMLYPMVKQHCDMMVSMYGIMYCPSMEEMDHISKEICEKHEKHHRDDENDDNLNDDDDMRQRLRFNRRIGTQDLIKVLLINELLGRRHNYGGYGY